MNLFLKKKPLTLVLGGTGKTGRRVVERLKAGGHAVRIGSRSAVPSFDWD
ncbi:MAG: NmrA family transcriptional regulator, partial [Pseudomonadota bacterium]